VSIFVPGILAAFWYLIEAAHSMGLAAITTCSPLAV
jgi:hypothetical protein